MDLLAHLEAYLAVVEEASFSRAADRLGIAQPLLSRRVKSLEAHLGGRLFDRSRRQITTTDLGVFLAPYAREVLDRAQRLRHVARSVQASAVRVVGVPADCDPAALARVIRAGAAHDMTLGVQEMPPDARAAGMSAGSLAYALVRVAPEHAALRVPLGLASGPPSDGPAGPEPGRTGAGRTGRPPVVYLEDLRPHRGYATVWDRHTQAPIFTMVEDEVTHAKDRLVCAAARAGLPQRLIRSAGPAASPLAETLAGRAMLLCSQPFARRHGARWAPLGDASLHRGYDVAAAGRQLVPGWLVTLLAAAVGAAPASTVARAGDTDAATRLAALG